MKDDLISRQAAIGIIQSMYPGMPRIPWMRKDWQERYAPFIRTENAIRELPSAQPEIIRCKDCKHWLHEHLCIELSKYGTIETLPNEYCKRAERRTDV